MYVTNIKLYGKAVLVFIIFFNNLQLWSKIICFCFNIKYYFDMKRILLGNSHNLFSTYTLMLCKYKSIFINFFFFTFNCLQVLFFLTFNIRKCYGLSKNLLPLIFIFYLFKSKQTLSFSTKNKCAQHVFWFSWPTLLSIRIDFKTVAFFVVVLWLKYGRK